MCKILILQSSPKSPEARRKLIAHAWAYFAHSGESDGYGAMWVSSTGLLSWAKSSYVSTSTSPLPEFVEGFHDSLHLDLPGNGGWMMLHGRRATCGINVENTHPMLDAGLGLIHNGVVKSERFKNVTTTCDSELLLRAIDQEGVTGLKDITGYYAFGMLRKRRDGWHALIARDDTAKLRVGRLPNGRTAWSTTDEGLAIANAKPVGNAKPMTAVEFAPDNTYSVMRIPSKPITVKRDTEIDDLWSVSSGRFPARSYSKYASNLTH